MHTTIGSFVPTIKPYTTAPPIGRVIKSTKASLSIVNSVQKKNAGAARCTESKTFEKTVNRHIWEDYLEQAEDVQHSPLGKTSYALRSQTTPRIFADAKEKHAMRYTLYRGLKAVTNWGRIKYAAMNLKKLAL